MSFPVVEAESEPVVEDTPINHVALPVHVPDLTGITNQELQAIRSYIQAMSRDARKKSNVVISKTETLRPLWMKTIGLGTRVSEEERRPIFDAFEHELLRHPQAFVNYALANSLSALDSALREEISRRTKVEPPPKKK